MAEFKIDIKWVWWYIPVSRVCKLIGSVKPLLLFNNCYIMHLYYRGGRFKSYTVRDLFKNHI
jgi:hypothetical protein